MNLQDRVIAVIGGAGLLGSAVTKSILKNGGIPVVVDNEEKAILELDYYQCDIRDTDQVDRLIATIDKRYGRIDGMVNCSYPKNSNYGRDFFDVEYNDFCENLSWHLGGYFLTTQKFAKYFTEKMGGSVVNISSVYGVISPKFEIYEGCDFTMPVEYSAIKSGLIHISRYVAKLLKNSNVRVNVVSPGGIENGQPELFQNKYAQHCVNKGMLDSKDVTGVICFLLSEDSKYINGQNIIVDDGFTL